MQSPSAKCSASRICSLKEVVLISMVYTQQISSAYSLNKYFWHREGAFCKAQVELRLESRTVIFGGTKWVEPSDLGQLTGSANRDSKTVVGNHQTTKPFNAQGKSRAGQLIM